MDHSPCIKVKLSTDVSDQKPEWEWTITRFTDSDTFESALDGVTSTYENSDVHTVVELIAKDHIGRFYGKRTVIIESNLGFAPYKTNGSSLHKHLRHSLHLFSKIKKIIGPPEIIIDYT